MEGEDKVLEVMEKHWEELGRKSEDMEKRWEMRVGMSWLCVRK